MPDSPKPFECLLVAGGQWHDIDFARLELLKLLAEDDRIRVRVREDFEDLPALQRADFLISYTCNVEPSPEAQIALRDFVSQGGRWYALHGTNALLRQLENGTYDAPDVAPTFTETLGSRFVAHPPIAPYRVEITRPDHPLVRGIAPFETDDELYLLEVKAELTTLLHARFAGAANSFAQSSWDEQDHPVFYLRALGGGGVLYLTLGHCRGHYDMRPTLDYFPTVQRGAWELSVFYDLLRRGIDWCKERGTETAVS